MAINTHKIILLLLLAGSHQLFSQNTQNDVVERYVNEYRTVDGQFKYRPTEGNPYLNDQFTKGFLKFKDGDSLSINMRYDLFNDEIQYLKNDQMFVLINYELLDYIRLNGELIVYKYYIADDQMVKGYLIQSIKDKCSLYRSERVELEDVKVYGDTQVKFKQKQITWLFSHKSFPIAPFTPNLKGLKQLSSDETLYKKLKNHIKENHLKINKEEDLITLFRYYNSLL